MVTSNDITTNLPNIRKIKIVNFHFHNNVTS